MMATMTGWGSPGRRMRTGARRKQFAAVLALGCALLSVGTGATAVPAAGNSNESSQGSTSNEGSPSNDSGSGSVIPEGLDDFYGQTVSWYPCGATGGMERTEAEESNSFSCAMVTVPLDYEDPDGQTIQIALKKRAADGESHGSLFINPGGPGSSGVQLVETASQGIFSQDLLAGYDVIGFDPRGVGSSTAIDCGQAGPAGGAGAGQPQPGQSFEDWAQGYSAGVTALEQQCAEHSEPGLLDHVGTLSSARDLDVLRAVMGEESLNYLGYSYGTGLGYTYAELLPDNTGRMVLDGALDPSLSAEEIDLGMAEGNEIALESYVEACQAGQTGADCPLSGEVENGVQQVRDLIASANTSPMGTSEPDQKVTGDQMSQVIRGALSTARWQELTAALTPAITQGDASVFALAANQMTQSAPAASMATMIAIMCQDRPSQGDMNSWENQYEEAQEVSPTFGAAWTNSDMTCAAWGHGNEPLPADITAEGASPILVVGTTGDPATRYEWAEALAEQLDSGHLLTWEGEGHCAYGRGSSCISGAVDDCLLNGKLPKDDLVCSG